MLQNNLSKALKKTQQYARSQPKSTQEPEIICPECKDGYGWVNPPYFDENGNHDPSLRGYPCTACEKRKQVKVLENHQVMSGLTEAEKKVNFSKIKTEKRPGTKKVVNALSNFVKDGATGMLTIYGPHGNGKTTALIATVNECLDQGIPAIYVITRDLLNWIQDAFNQNKSVKDETMLQRLERFKNVRVLAIDELQALKLSDWRVEQLENIIDHRWRYGPQDGKCGTIFAMNEAPAELQSERIYTRIMHGSKVAETVIKNTDPDIRPYLAQRK